MLLDAARRDEHVAFELINGWSYSAAKQLGGNQVPGMWMTGNAMRLMERTRPGVLPADLVACNAYAAGSPLRRRCVARRSSILGARDIMAPPTQRAGADRGACRTSAGRRRCPTAAMR